MSEAIRAAEAEEALREIIVEALNVTDVDALVTVAHAERLTDDLVRALVNAGVAGPRHHNWVDVSKIRALQNVLKYREKELLELKGPCSTCHLHYAHSGPCEI